MAKIPDAVLQRQPVVSGLPLRGRGKVRDSYDLPGHPDKMLVVASDRISIFDFVLNALIPQKGQVLSALSFFWNEMLQKLFHTDVVTVGSGIKDYVPEALGDYLDLQKRSTVVNILNPTDVEDIARIILTGSGWKDYQKDHTVGGHCLPPGLKDGSLLPFPIYTPSTKATEGHDVNITADSVASRYGHVRERLTLQATGLIANYAAARGIRFGDTKFELSLVDGQWILMDEKGTPDSSRYFDEAALKKAVAAGKPLPSLDKQYVRNWGKSHGVDKRDPKKPEDVEYVHSLVVPDDVIRTTTNIYRYIFWRLTGYKIEAFQREVMGIKEVKDRPVRVEILVGSKSDMEQAETAFMGLCLGRMGAHVLGRVSVISCHRNPDALRSFANDELTKADVVIAGAGMAAALPGIVKSWLCCVNRSDIPVIGVAFKGKNLKQDRAAIESIEELPGQPVELDSNGHAYFGPEGCEAACQAAIGSEFLPRGMESKPAEIGFCDCRT